MDLCHERVKLNPKYHHFLSCFDLQFSGKRNAIDFHCKKVQRLMLAAISEVSKSPVFFLCLVIPFSESFLKKLYTLFACSRLVIVKTWTVCCLMRSLFHNFREIFFSLLQYCTNFAPVTVK